MKKVSKIASIFLALVLAFCAPAVLTGCKSSATLEEASRAMVNAGEYYRKAHTGYDKFEDTTLTINVEFASSEDYEFEYYAKEGDTQKVKGTFTDSYAQKVELTIAVKNVTIGSGDNAYNVVHFSTKSVSRVTSKEYYLDDNELLKSEEVNGTETEEYVLASVANDGGVSFYEAHYDNYQEGDEEAEVTKEYYEFSDYENYMSFVETCLGRVSQLIYNSYFLGQGGETMMQMLLTCGEFTKDGDKFAVDLAYTAPNVSSYGSVLIKYEMSIGFNGKKLGEASVKESFEQIGSYQYSSDAKLNVKESASAISLNIEGYTQVDSVMTIYESMIPSSLSFND